MQLLQVKEVSKRFGKVQALDGVSFAVEQGEIFGFLGPNGAGKSTTIRCIMDFIRPDKGSVNVFGKSVWGYGVALRRGIGYVPSEPNLYANWTVDEHIGFVAEMRNIKAAAANKLKKELGLSGNSHVRHLSTGNQQKLAIVLAMMNDPKLLILDEPTRGLDPLLQLTFHKILKEYSRHGGTVFLSSHNLPEVDELCTRVAVIRQGKLAAETSVEELKQQSAYNVRVSFAGKVPKLDNLDITNLAVTNHTASFRAKGDIGVVLRALDKQKLSNLEINRATLEELFMEMYE